jgi:molybdopterin-guanine dinucleotide biosynthesis protein A
MPEVGVLILAGGEATRLPGKLTLAAGEVPMLVRVYRNVSPGRETYISCKGGFPPEIDALLPCPMVVDNWRLRGPIGGLLSTLSAMSSPLVFAVAGDAPLIDSTFIDRLTREWIEGDEAVVPFHHVAGKVRMEPLAAIYDRRAFLREGYDVLASDEGALRAVIDRLQTRMVHIEEAQIFTNVNTPADYENLRAILTS